MSPQNLSKTELRQYFNNLRSNATAEYQKEASEKAMNVFLQNINFSKKWIISGYYPTNNELSPLPLLEYFNSINLTTALPVIKGKDLPLDFQKWSIGDNLYQSSFFKIQQPNNKLVSPDIIIVPLLAFDKNRNRLGYGGGFYDRTLKLLKSAGHDFVSIGYAYSFQETDLLPTHEGDAKLDYIVTHEKII